VIHVPATIPEQCGDPAAAIATEPSCHVGDVLSQEFMIIRDLLTVGAGLLLAVPAPCKLCVHEHQAPAERGQHTCDDVQSLEVSLGRFFQDQLIESEISDSSLEPCVLQFQVL